MKEGVSMFFRFFDSGEIFDAFTWRYHGNMKGDTPEAVSNREKFNTRVIRRKGKIKKIIRAGQDDKADRNRVAIVSCLSPDIIAGVDGLVTRDRSIALEVTFADCLPILFADTKTMAIGIVHAGYRGIEQNIIFHALNQFKKLGVEAGNLKVGIGPGICGQCYEFSTKDAEKIFGAYREFIKLSEGNPGKCFIDLKGIVQKQLMLGGVKAENIRDSGICTFCNGGDYFSARKREDKSSPIEANLGIIGIK